MADAGRDEVAAVFDMLARMESEHLDALERRTEGIDLPPLPAAQYRWLDSGAIDGCAEACARRWLAGLGVAPQRHYLAKQSRFFEPAQIAQCLAADW